LMLDDYQRDQNYLSIDFLSRSPWIPAFAGMTKRNNHFLISVSPAKAGVQFKIFKREGPPTNGVNTMAVLGYRPESFMKGELLKKETIAAGAVNNPANLDKFLFDDIKHEILVHNKHSVAHFSEASVFWDQAKRWGSA
jgi:hypothetical protein